MGSFNRRQEADDLTDYVNNGWLSSAEFDGPTFLWNHLIREASQEDAAQRNDVNRVFGQLGKHRRHFVSPFRYAPAQVNSFLLVGSGFAL